MYGEKSDYLLETLEYLTVPKGNNPFSGVNQQVIRQLAEHLRDYTSDPPVGGKI